MKTSPAKSSCRVWKMDTSLFGTSRLRQVGDRAENARQSSSSFLAPRGPVCFSALRFPLQRKHRDATRSKHVKSYSKWHTRLAKLDFNLDLATGGGLRKFCFLLLHRDITFTVKDAAQSVSTESVHRQIAPCSDEQTKSVSLVFNGQRFYRTRFDAQNFIGGFRATIDIHHTMNTLLQCPDTAITNMGPIVVVTEKNGPTDVVLGADDRIVRSKNVDPVAVALGPIFCASAVSVL